MTQFLSKIHIRQIWQNILNNQIKKPIFWFKLIVFLAIFFHAFLQVSLFLDPDLGWHLREGQRIYEGGAVYSGDEYTFTMSGYKWNNHEWLTQVFLWILKSNNLWFFGELIFALLATLPFLFWITKSKYYEELIVIFFAYVTMQGIVGVRPQMITFLLFNIVLFTLIGRFRETENNKFFNYYAISLPLIFLLWANIHAGFFSAFILWAIFIFGKILENYIKNKHLIYNFLWKDVFVLAVAFLLTFLNPIGYLVYKEIFDVMTSSIAPRNINEWLPLFDMVFKSHIVISIAKLFFVAFSISCLFFPKNKTPIYLKLAFVFFLVMFLRSVRMAPFFISIAIPVIFMCLLSIRMELSVLKNGSILSKKKKKIFLVIIFISIAIFYIWNISNTLNLSKTVSYPEKAVEYLRNDLQKGQDIILFNPYSWGGYLINNLPEVKVFIDGRGPHWGEKGGYSAMKEYLKISQGDKDWADVLDRHRINTVLTDSPDGGGVLKKKNSPMIIFLKSIFVKIAVYFNVDDKKGSGDFYESLAKSGKWDVAFQDDTATVWRLKK